MFVLENNNNLEMQNEIKVNNKGKRGKTVNTWWAAAH
jgi:hypothetical protein